MILVVVVATMMMMILLVTWMNFIFLTIMLVKDNSCYNLLTAKIDFIVTKTEPVLIVKWLYILYFPFSSTF